MPFRAGLALPRHTLHTLTSVLLAAVLVAAAAPSATAEPSARADDAVAGSYIVTLTSDATVKGLIGDHDVAASAVTATYRSVLNGFTVRLPDAAAGRLAADPRVERVEPDRMFTIAATQTLPPWGLDRSDQRSRALSSTYTYGTTGKAVTAYVIDTGVRTSHVDFGGRVARGHNATDYVLANPNGCPLPLDRASTADDNGHGTHVAGTLGGSSYGVAKAVKIVPVKVLDCTGRGYMSDVIEGIDWVVGQHTPGTPAVANISLGDPKGGSIDVDDAVSAAVTNGITVVAAAGNSDAHACRFSPGRVAEALTVAASTSTDVRWDLSNTGSCVDLFAPGADIRSTFHTGDSATARASGTSMAAPHVAGAAARYLQSRPGASPATVAKALLADATRGVLSNIGTGSPNTLLYAGPRATRVGISTSKTRLTYGGRVKVSGSLSTADGLGVRGRPLKLQRRRAGTTRWVRIATVTTSSTGRVSYTDTPPWTASYRFVHPRSADYAASRSAARTVGVRTRVTANLSSTTVKRGDRAVIAGAVMPAHPRRGVVLQRYRAGAWRRVETATLNSKSRYRFRLPTRATGTFRYRVVRPRDTDHLTGHSPRRTLTVG